MRDRYNILVRASAGDADAKVEAVEIVLRAIRFYLEGNGALDLSSYCGLPPPTARRKFARMRSDYYICLAAQLIGASKPWPCAVALERELRVFFTSIWPAWRHYENPPDGASDLRTALFHAVRAEPGMKFSVRSLYRRIAAAESASPHQSLKGVLELKTFAQIDRDAEIEWGFSPELQAEFGSSLAAYQAYRRAEHAGVFHYIPSKTTDKNATGFVSEIPG